eukprot:TRINITY_DN25389_c0_g3_i2.p1 TRINITY_DN25389_c0_g3~~TRINITY_DN25389_c0_g3_i2.p1  ORF type:complete len:750 (-),score=194.20 TRINITY_DN25389_c0_g3_i2:268-2517(-)
MSSHLSEVEPRSAVRPAAFAPAPAPLTSPAAGAAAAGRRRGVDLRGTLQRFYAERRSDKLENVDRIVGRYDGDGVLGLWEQLGRKYALEPYEVLGWLGESVNDRVAVQWPEACVPRSALRALEEAAPGAGDDAGGSADAALRSTLDEALSREDRPAVSALLCRHGAPTAALRARAWRFFFFGHAEAEGKQQRLEAYRELRERQAAPARAPPPGSPAASSSPAPLLEEEVAALRAEIQASAATVLEGLQAQASASEAAFVRHPEVLLAVVSVVFCHACRVSRFLRGACELAAILVFALAGGDVQGLLEAEADAFWCLSQVVAELGYLDEEASEDERGWSLLCRYDGVLAEHLAADGLRGAGTALPARALLSRAGFSLAACQRLWDALLGDPGRKAEFVDFIVVALLVLARGELLQLRGSALVDAWLGLAAHADVQELMRTASALCLMERRGAAHCGPRAFSASAGAAAASSAIAAVSGRVADMARGETSSLWNKFRSAGTDALVASGVAARDVVRDLLAATVPDPATPASASASPRRQRVASGASGAAASSATETPRSSLGIALRVCADFDGETVLTQDLAQCLLDFLPIRLRMPGAVEWNLRYAPRAHGVSLATLYRNLALSGASVFLVKDHEGYVFGGFAPAAWEPRGKFYGSGEAFVFSFGLLEKAVAGGKMPEPAIYPWTSKNSFFMYADSHGLGMGGGDGHFAWTLQSDLLHGHSSPTDTFGNATLASGQDFVATDVEVWTLDEL